jgi:hypothetical protein
LWMLCRYKLRQINEFRIKLDDLLELQVGCCLSCVDLICLRVYV